MAEKKSLHDILEHIQTHLISKKDKQAQNYSYRTAEGILADVKPFLAEYGCTLTFDEGYDYINDIDVVTHDGKIVKGAYVYHSKAILSNGSETISADGYAEVARKIAAMSTGQIWGATMSYARKYALGALFAIDNEDDLDDLNQKHTVTDKVNAAKADFLTIKTDADLNKWAKDHKDVMGIPEILEMGQKKRAELSKKK